MVVNIHCLSNHSCYYSKNHYCCHHNLFPFFTLRCRRVSAPISHYPYYNLSFEILPSRVLKLDTLTLVLELGLSHLFECKGNAYFLKNGNNDMTKWRRMGFFWLTSRCVTPWLDVGQRKLIFHASMTILPSKTPDNKSKSGFSLAHSLGFPGFFFLF